MDKILLEITELMQSFFKKDSLVVSVSTSANDIEEWDSLNHMSFISAIENHFNIEFEFFEIMDLENIGELVESISKKIKD